MTTGDLDERAIRAELARLGARPERPIRIEPTTGSTSDDARAAAAAGAPAGAAFVADAQSSGRGRGAHVWHSPPGENVYLSLVLRPRVEPARLAPISLVVGAAVARVVERRAGEGAGVTVKWPNDVLAGGRKIAGVLVEGQLRGDRVSSIVAGVGLNVRTRSFPDELAERATSLALLGCADLDRSLLVAERLVEIAAAGRAVDRDGLASVRPELSRRDALAGRRVIAGELAGVASGIDEDGRLLVRDGSGIDHAVVAGEVVLCPDGRESGMSEKVK